MPRYKYKTKVSNPYKLVSLVLLLVIIALSAYILFPENIIRTAAPVAIPDLSTSNYSLVNVSTNIVGNAGAVTLTGNCRAVTASVEPIQAQSIQNALDGTYDKRPNAHDIAAETFQTLGIDVLMVKVTEQKEDAYFSKIIIRQGDTILNLDARPSDAIAIALRMKDPIYMNNNLLQNNGVNVC